MDSLMDFQNLYNRLIRETLIPLVVMISASNFVLLLPYAIVRKKQIGLFEIFSNHSIWKLLQEVWTSINWFDMECWLVIFGTFAWGIFTMIALPGEKFYGPLTINNFRPQYWKNGFKFYILSMLIVVPWIWKSSVLHLFYKIPDFIGCLSLFGFALCIFLYIKGLVAPDPGIHDLTNNPIFDFYWGIELYPQLAKKISFKMLVNSRFGLWLWQVCVLICWKAHYELHLNQYFESDIGYPISVMTILQTIYFAKFYYLEHEYVQSFDMSYERFGYMLAWGCITFVQGFLNAHALCLVISSPVSDYNAYINSAILLIGVIALTCCYLADHQRSVVRLNDGQCTIFGRKPILIRAKYIDNDGQEKNSILLASGFWGLARHFNYFFEIISVLSFGLPALSSSIIAYAYFFFLLGLIPHRLTRDDQKCSLKYGRYWDEYKKLVPYKMIPYIY